MFCKIDSQGRLNLSKVAIEMINSDNNQTIHLFLYMGKLMNEKCLQLALSFNDLSEISDSEYYWIDTRKIDDKGRIYISEEVNLIFNNPQQELWEYIKGKTIYITFWNNFGDKT